MDANKLKLAKVLFIVNAILIGVLGGALLGMYGAIFASEGGPDLKQEILAFAVFFFPLSILWSLFCYGAYKGLQSSNIALQVIFWLFIAWNLFAFPIGTIFSLVIIYIWYTQNKEQTSN